MTQEENRVSVGKKTAGVRPASWELEACMTPGVRVVEADLGKGSLN